MLVSAFICPTFAVPFTTLTGMVPVVNGNFTWFSPGS
jgi:hypothetical protein